MELARYTDFHPITKDFTGTPKKSYDVFDNGAVPSDYTVITDIVDYENGGKAVGVLMDRIAVRKGLKALISTKMTISVESDWDDQVKFDLLNDDEKSIACHWFIVKNKSFRLEVVNDQSYWNQESVKYREWTCKARIARSVDMQTLIFERMVNVNDAIAMINYDFSLWSKYHAGTVSLASDGQEGLKDYFNSEPETSFANNGFRGNPYPFNTGHTADSVADELIAIVDC